MTLVPNSELALRQECAQKRHDLFIAAYKQYFDAIVPELIAEIKKQLGRKLTLGEALARVFKVKR